MKNLVSIVSLGLLSYTAYTATPSAQEILSKAREALGGPKLAAIQSLTVSGDYSHAVYNVNPTGEAKGQPDVLKGDLELNFLLPDKFLKAETMMLPNGMTGPVMLECLNGEEIWNDIQSQPGMMVRIANADRPEADRKRGLNGNFARYLLAFLMSDRPAFPITFTYAGEAEAPDGHADAVDAKGPDNFAVRIYFDQKSHLPLMMTYRGPAAARRRTMMISGGGHGSPGEMQNKLPPPETREVDFQLRLGDYRKVNGAMLPHLLSWSSEGALSEEFEVKKYSVNGKLDAGKFRK